MKHKRAPNTLYQGLTLHQRLLSERLTGSHWSCVLPYEHVNGQQLLGVSKLLAIVTADASGAGRKQWQLRRRIFNLDHGRLSWTCRDDRVSRTTRAAGHHFPVDAQLDHVVVGQA